MNQKRQKNSNNHELSAISQPLKKMIPQLLLSVSLFSFLFSYASFFNSSSSPLLYPPKLRHFSAANYLHFLNHALNKNCLFLICNGLLVFLAKTSGFIRPPTSNYDLSYDPLQNRMIEEKESLLEKCNYVLEGICAERNEEEEKSGPEQREVAIFIAESEEDGGGDDDDDDDAKMNDESVFDHIQTRSCWLFDDEEEQLYVEESMEEKQEQDEEEREEEEEEEEEEKKELSTEELNQKFEDFIRRMKEEIIVNETMQKGGNGQLNH